MPTPEYRLTEPAFFEPNLLPAGTIIATDAPPGPHMEPWNAEAQARMDAWLDEEVDEIDLETKKPTGRKIKSHAKYRRAAYVPKALETASVVEQPDEPDKGLTLAELNQKKATDPRPPPARQFKKLSPLEKAAAVADAEPPKATVLVKGPKDTTVEGGVSR